MYADCSTCQIVINSFLKCYLEICGINIVFVTAVRPLEFVFINYFSRHVLYTFNFDRSKFLFVHKSKEKATSLINLWGTTPF